MRDRLLGTIDLVSISYQSGPSSFGSEDAKITGDGRFVVFRSSSDNLVPGDTNLLTDLFVRDLWTGVTERCSVTSDGQDADDNALEFGISGDGRHVVWRSAATNLIPFDANPYTDIYHHDRRTGGAELTMTDVVAGSMATFTLTGATPSSLVPLGISILGQGPAPSPWGPLELSPPVGVTPPMLTDAQGDVTFQIQIPPAMLGLPLWVQGVDAAADYPTTPFGTIVQ